MVLYSTKKKKAIDRASSVSGNESHFCYHATQHSLIRDKDAGWPVVVSSALPRVYRASAQTGLRSTAPQC